MSDVPLIPQKPWYKDGLPFKCTGCGQCCTGTPGYTWVNLEEIERMAAYLNLTVQDFGMRYLRKVGNRYALTEKRVSYDCVFLKENKCLVYPVRPTQCQTFPFWPEHLIDRAGWEEAARRCEGISHDAPIVPFDEIERQREQESVDGRQ